MAMGWALTRFSLTKAVPLTISRGTTAAVVRLELRLERDGLVGRGETGGFETGHRAFALEAVEQELLGLLPQLEALDPHRPQRFEPLLATLESPGPFVPSTWPCGTGMGNGSAIRCGGSGDWTQPRVWPPASPWDWLLWMPCWIVSNAGGRSCRRRG